MDGLLSLAHIPNIVVVDMAHIVPNQAANARKAMHNITVKVTRRGIFSIHSIAGWLTQTNKILCEWQMIIIFTLFFVDFKQEQHNNVTYTESNTRPVSGSDLHLCIFDKFHERNMTSKILALTSIRNIPELSGKFNSENWKSISLKIWQW